MASFGSIFVWWLLSTLLALAALPLTTQLFRFLPDKGLGLTRIVGLLFTGYLAWLLGFVSNGPLTTALAWIVLAGLGLYLFNKRKAETLAFLDANSGLVFIYEMAFLVLFFVLCVVRMKHPAIVDQEKFMDFAFFNSIQRSAQMPPADPWLAGVGNYINYYYFGYFLLANFARMVPFVSPDIAYNLCVGFVFGLCGTAILSLGYNLTRTLWAGALGILGFQIFGNLHGALQVMQGNNFNWWEPTRLMKDVAKDGHYLNRWWWSASPSSLAQVSLNADAARDGLISEFPAFSFLHGDLHPHFTALPLAFLVLALGLNLVKNPDGKALVPGSRRERNSDLLALSLALAALAMANTWDLPAYGALASLLLLCQQHWLGQFQDSKLVKQWLLPSGLLLGGLGLLAAPFLIFFHSPAAQGFGMHGAKTGLRDTLLFWGFFLAVLGPFVWLRLTALGASNKVKVVKIETKSAAKPLTKISVARVCSSCGMKLRPGKELCGQCGTRNPEPLQNEEVTAGAQLSSPSWAMAFAQLFTQPEKAFQNPVVLYGLPVLGLGFLGAVAVWPTVAVFALLASLGILLVALRGDSVEALYTAALITMGSLLILGCEFFYLKDGFAGNPNLTRMNTVFKFYFQAWVLFSVALPFALWWVVQRLQTVAPFTVRVVHSTAIALLALAALVYPIKAVAFVWADYDGQGLVPTMDGSDWFKRRYPSDWGAIEQLREKVSGQPVIAEAVGGAYTHFARVASYTGFRSVMGWANHEGQWRKSWASDTGDKVDRLYAAETDAPAASALLSQLSVDYVFVGELERQKYGVGVDKFAQMFSPPFIQSGGTLVYKVR